MGNQTPCQEGAWLLLWELPTELKGEQAGGHEKRGSPAMPWLAESNGHTDTGSRSLHPALKSHSLPVAEREKALGKITKLIAQGPGAWEGGVQQ